MNFTMTTRDGFYFDNKTSKLHSGLKCKGAVDPTSNTANTTNEFDVIVIGAGYAGLTACRDLCVAGKCDVLSTRTNPYARIDRIQCPAHRSQGQNRWQDIHN